MNLRKLNQPSPFPTFSCPPSPFPAQSIPMQEQKSILLRGGRVIDSYVGRDQIADIAIDGGRIVERAPKGAQVIDAAGWIVCPGLMDIHVHLREPGQGHKETIETGTRAAAAGGFTYVVCMPNTNPPLDEPERIRWVIERAREAGIMAPGLERLNPGHPTGYCEVAPVACITRGRAGKELTDFAALKAAGAVAFSDDGSGVDDDNVMALAFERAARCDALLIQHCEFRTLSAGGVMHLGEVSRRLGFPGLDPRSEEAMIERDIDLCRKFRARYHVAHISTARAVELVRRAKAEGLPVTTEVCTHHLMLTDDACATADPNTKMHPPLRPQGDVDACRQGLLDGTIDCIVTDHAPHTPQEKAAGFLKAPAGIVGLETALGLAAKAMIDTGLADWPRLIHWFTAGAARVMHRPAQPITPGSEANLTLIAPRESWRVDAQKLYSKSKNTPFDGWELTCGIKGTIRDSQVCWRDSDEMSK